MIDSKTRCPAAMSGFWLLCIAWLCAAGGCARSVGTIDHARIAFHTGQLQEANNTLTKLVRKQNNQSDAAALDLAIVKMSAGDVRGAESDLRRLRDEFDRAPKRTLVRDTASMLADDTIREYRPAGYEEVMIRAMLAVCSLASDRVDAESYALQANLKQEELRRNAESRGLSFTDQHFQPIALAPYLRGVLREATHHDYDDAAKAYQLVSAAEPNFAPAGDDIQRATTGAHSRPGHGVLYVIACVGQGPRLVETEATTTSAALSMASVILNAETNQQDGAEENQARISALSNIASVKVPAVVVPDSPIAAVGVRVGGVLYGATQTLTDVGELAKRQNEAEMPFTLARAVVRRATKESTVAMVGDSLGMEGTVGSLFHFAAASAWAGSEKADTRCWGLLPRQIQVLRAELPAGEHHVSIEPLGHAGAAIGQARTRTVEMIDGCNTYAIVVAPDEIL